MKISKLPGILIAVFLFLFTFNALAATKTEPLTPAQIQQVKKIIRSYLVANPQILVEASDALQKQQFVELQQKTKKAIQENAKALFNNPNSPVAGNPKGNIIMVEFFDYQCPHCKDMVPILKNLIAKNHNLKIIYKEFPIFSGSEMYAKAALSAKQQGKYAKFHNALMQHEGQLTKPIMLAIAKKADINIKELEKNTDDKTISQQIEQNYALAKALNIKGTPAFIITNRKRTKTEFVPGAVSQKTLQEIITQVGSAG